MSQFAFSTSVTSWLNNGTHLRVYTSDGANITERCWDGDGWSTGAFAQSGQTVAAVCWLDSSEQIHLRVYVSDAGTVKEYCLDDDHWFVGAFPATPGSEVSATTWQDNGPHIRVYITQSNGQVKEKCFDGGASWYDGIYTDKN